MRRKDKEITDRKITDQILEKAEVCRLGLLDDGDVYIVPVSYAYSEGAIYFHSSPMGRKMDIMRKNNKVSFEIELGSEIIRNEIPCEWTLKFRSVMGTGLVRIINEPEAKKKGLDLIMKKYGATGELKYDDNNMSRTVVVQLRINSVTGKQAGEW